MDDLAFPRFLFRGRAFVYGLPCRDDTLLKIGFSRAPIQRMQTLHARFFEFFELENGWLIETESVREARAIERRYIATFSPYQAFAPLVVSDDAGGYTEWYRGIGEDALALAQSIADSQGYVLHRLSTWLRGALQDSATLLYSWSAWMADAIEYETYNVPTAMQTGHHARALRSVLDLYSSLDIDLTANAAPAALAWYRGEARPR